MQVRTVLRGLVITTVLAVLAALLPQLASAGPRGASARYLVVARSSADYSALRAKAVKEGARVIRDLPQAKTLVVNATASARSSLAADRRTVGVARSQVRRITAEPSSTPNLSAPGLQGATRVQAKAPAATTAAGINPDPAFDYKGLLWDYRRIGLPRGWKTTAGSGTVTVGVADTGLDFTHRELRNKVKRVIDFTGLEDPPICKTRFGVSDADLAAEFGGPEKTDWNGHGSWIGGRIAAELNGTGINGIAPKVNLVALKISQWCGSANDDELLAAFITAANLRLDIVNISFGGYTDISTPEGAAIYQAYRDAVLYARSKGTVIVASAGNEHVRVGRSGRVLNHGQLTNPAGPAEDYPDLFGQVEMPGGVPGYVDVAATNRWNVRSSTSCPPGTIGDPGDPDADPPVPPDYNATCKPLSDRHRAPQGKKDQLSYFSSYGPRIDIAGPGGARKFNLALWDRGGTPGFPYTLDDLTNTWQVFSTTSNWAVQIPCFTFTRGSGFPQGQCYSTIQGTSMAAPQVSGALALIASAHKSLRKRPTALLYRLKRLANDDPYNYTRAISATDTSPGDLTGVPCTLRYCHLTGPRIPDSEAYGAGLVNVATP
jgi:lantibiotic leader peptide-processing serine protease